MTGKKALIVFLVVAAAWCGGVSAEGRNNGTVEPRIWIELESRSGAVSRLELLDMSPTTLTVRSLDGLEFDFEQKEAARITVSGTGREHPWKSAGEGEPPRRPRDLAPAADRHASEGLPVTPYSGENQPSERIRQAIKYLQPAPNTRLYIAFMQRQGRLDEAEERLKTNVREAEYLGIALSNMGGLLELWSIKRLNREQIEQNIRDVVSGIASEEVRQGAKEVFAYLKESREVFEELLRRSEPTRPGMGFGETRRPPVRRPEEDARPFRRRLPD